MRVHFIPPSVEELYILLTPPRGGGTDDIRIFNSSRRYTRGGGIFSFLSGIARRAAPFIMRTLAPAALSLGQNVLDDINNDKQTFKQSLKKRGIETLKGVGKQMIGGRVQKKNKQTKKLVNIKRFTKAKYNDVLS